MTVVSSLCPGRLGHWLWLFSLILQADLAPSPEATLVLLLLAIAVLEALPVSESVCYK